jgi:hypothetical protein
MNDDEIDLIRDALRSLSGTPVKDERDQQRRMELWRELGRLIALASNGEVGTGESGK